MIVLLVVIACGVLRCLKFAAMVFVEVYEERFNRLKELDGGKDKVIEVSCLTVPWFADVYS